MNSSELQYVYAAYASRVAEARKVAVATGNRDLTNTCDRLMLPDNIRKFAGGGLFKVAQYDQAEADLVNEEEVDEHNNIDPYKNKRAPFNRDEVNRRTQYKGYDYEREWKDKIAPQPNRFRTNDFYNWWSAFAVQNLEECIQNAYDRYLSNPRALTILITTKQNLPEWVQAEGLTNPEVINACIQELNKLKDLARGGTDAGIYERVRQATWNAIWRSEVQNTKGMTAEDVQAKMGVYLPDEQVLEKGAPFWESGQQAEEYENSEFSITYDANTQDFEGRLRQSLQGVVNLAVAQYLCLYTRPQGARHRAIGRNPNDLDKFTLDPNTSIPRGENDRFDINGGPGAGHIGAPTPTTVGEGYGQNGGEPDQNTYVRDENNDIRIDDYSKLNPSATEEEKNSAAQIGKRVSNNLRSLFTEEGTTKGGALRAAYALMKALDTTVEDGDSAMSRGNANKARVSPKLLRSLKVDVPDSAVKREQVVQDGRRRTFEYVEVEMPIDRTALTKNFANYKDRLLDEQTREIYENTILRATSEKAKGELASIAVDSIRNDCKEVWHELVKMLIRDITQQIAENDPKWVDPLSAVAPLEYDKAKQKDTPESRRERAIVHAVAIATTLQAKVDQDITQLMESELGPNATEYTRRGLGEGIPGSGVKPGTPPTTPTKPPANPSATSAS